MALGKLKKGSRCVRRQRVRLKSGKTVMRCKKFAVAGGRKKKASKKASRKTSRRKSTKRRRRRTASAGKDCVRVCRGGYQLVRHSPATGKKYRTPRCAKTSGRLRVVKARKVCSRGGVKVSRTVRVG